MQIFHAGDFDDSMTPADAVVAANIKLIRLLKVGYVHAHYDEDGLSEYVPFGDISTGFQNGDSHRIHYLLEEVKEQKELSICCKASLDLLDEPKFCYICGKDIEGK